MSRRAILVVVVFLGVIVLANIVLLAIWLPARKSSTAAASQPAPVSPAQSNISPAQARSPASAVAQSAGQFTVVRQLTSTSGKVVIKYLRERQSKLRRIVVEDAANPKASTVLWESKRPAWALVSPDDQWIAVNERDEKNGGGARLYRRSNDSSANYVAAEGPGPNVQGLQESVWKTYLSANRADPNTQRRGVTIDATAWENDSRKLDVSVAYLPTAGNPDVPEPWSCTYDVASKQAEPIPDQPVAGQEIADAATAGDEETDQSAVDETAENDASASESELAEDDEYPGEKFPATRLDELAVPDVNESSLDEINYAINEMFARHGAEFKQKDVAQQFSQFEWYKPRPGATFKDVENEFSDLEKANLKVLERCRDAKVAATRRKSNSVRGQRVQEESTAEKVMRGIKTWQELGAPLPPHP